MRNKKSLQDKINCKCYEVRLFRKLMQKAERELQKLMKGGDDA